jgi:hypothetical protein
MLWGSEELASFQHLKKVYLPPNRCLVVGCFHNVNSLYGTCNAWHWVPTMPENAMN